MKHCCIIMYSHIQSGEIKLKYNAKFREYGISVSDGGNSFQSIKFCPWCGKKLPSSLRDKWFKIVCDDLGFEPEDSNIPDKYKTEKWWSEKE